MCDALFADWPEAFPDKPARIQVTPPKLVDVELGAILPHDPNATRSTVLRIRAACLDLTGTTPGSCWRGPGSPTPRGSPSSASPPPPAVAADRCRCANGSQHAPSGRGDARHRLASASQQTYHRSNDVRHAAPDPAVTRALLHWKGARHGPAARVVRADFSPTTRTLGRDHDRPHDAEDNAIRDLAHRFPLPLAQREAGHPRCARLVVAGTPTTMSCDERFAGGGDQR